MAALSPVPQTNDVVTPARRVTTPWFSWLNVLRDLVVLLSTYVHIVQGDPNGSEVGNVGHIALRTDGGVGSTFYVKEAGHQTTAGWRAP